MTIPRLGTTEGEAEKKMIQGLRAFGFGAKILENLRNDREGHFGNLVFTRGTIVH